MSTISKKICLVGDFGVGKTSLIRRFVEQQFSDQYLSTVGVKISRKTLDFPTAAAPEQQLQFLIWDIEGNTKFKSIAPNYLQGAAAAIIIGDVTRLETLTNLTLHIENFTDANPQGLIVVGLNKSDLLLSETQSQLLQAYSFSADTRVLATYSTSAKLGHNVDPLFQTIAAKLLT